MAENSLEQKPKRTRKQATPKATIKPEDAPKVPEEIKPDVVPPTPVEPDEPVVPDEPEKPTYPIKPEDAPKVPEETKPDVVPLSVELDEKSPYPIRPSEKIKQETKAVSPEEEEAAMEREFLEMGKLKVCLYKLNPNLEDGKSKWAFALVVGDLKHIHFKGSFVRAHKWAENYCLSHGLDPKTIQLIKK